MPSSPPSESPSPSPQIRQWQHTDSPFLWSNAIVGSLILHLLILVPIARSRMGDRTAAATEKLIAVEVISSPTSSPPESFPELTAPPNPATPFVADFIGD
ncbi:MAG TPA: hypothetical protein IGS31_19425, partial [Oscillatoriales cyanobacterium M4454_W2019_049]|nr:hypothetical protein [Oscillatoriales cyanobacterium M4454_W2019_049]